MEVKYDLIPWIKDLMEWITESELFELKKVFLKKVYVSFFILEPDNILEFQENINETGYTISVFKNILTSLFEKEIDYLEDIILDMADFDDIKGSYLFPFIKSEYEVYNRRYSWDSEKIKNILNIFHTNMFSYIFIYPFQGKLIVFTDIKEEKILPILQLLPDFSALELHNIIPSIIDSLKDKMLKDEKAGINEIWIWFPLSMLWWHADIRDKVKKWWVISWDNNFKNLIRYGLLNFLKLKFRYTISFNKDNEKNKFNLHGYLYDYQDDCLNEDIINDLESFLSDIENASLSSNSDFFGLPLYILSWKYTYSKSDSWYPEFHYDVINGNLKLSLSNWDDERTFDITWVFPQYIKINDNNVFSYLKVKENIQDNDIKHYWFEDDFFIDKKTSAPCDDFLYDIREKMSHMFHYDCDEEFEWKVKPEVTPSDFYFSASSEEQDYLINICNSKRGRNKISHHITVDIYKLSSFNYWRDLVDNSMKKFNSNYNNKLLGTLKLAIDKNSPTKITCWTYEDELKCIKHCKTNSSDIDGYIKPEQFNDVSYIDRVLKYEDYISLCLIKIFEQNNYSSFFGWKKNGKYTRELADIISIEEDDGKINVNLFHIKTKPFESKRVTNLEASFSAYTQVVWQTLEKAKAFMDEPYIEWILKGLEKYFYYEKQVDWELSRVNADNHLIFEYIESKIKWLTSGTININVYFSVNFKDYWWDLNDSNSVDELSFITNWKRLKMVNDIFTSNINNVTNNLTPHIKLNLNLGMLVTKTKKSEWWIDIKNDLFIVDDINSFFQ